MERIDDLNFNGLKIIQSNEVFSFSIDAVLLAHFGYVPKKGKIIDLCAGNGAVGLLCTEKTKAGIDFVELQPRLAEMAERSIALNKKEAQCHVHCADLKELSQYFAHDGVVSLLGEVQRGVPFLIAHVHDVTVRHEQHVHDSYRRRSTARQVVDG